MIVLANGRVSYSRWGHVDASLQAIRPVHYCSQSVGPSGPFGKHTNRPTSSDLVQLELYTLVSHKQLLADLIHKYPKIRSQKSMLSSMFSCLCCVHCPAPPPSPHRLPRCYEKSIIEKEISEMRKSSAWEDTRLSIVSAKELVKRSRCTQKQANHKRSQTVITFLSFK